MGWAFLMLLKLVLTGNHQWHWAGLKVLIAHRIIMKTWMGATIE